MRSRCAPLLSILAICALLAGCQRIAEVSGTVRLDGKPLKGLIVIFDPEVKDAPRGVATTTDDGGYRIRRLGAGAKSGVPVGNYVVRVMADTDDPKAAKIPAKYARGSGLTFEVKGGGNVFDIEMSNK